MADGLPRRRGYADHPTLDALSDRLQELEAMSKQLTFDASLLAAAFGFALSCLGGGFFLVLANVPYAWLLFVVGQAVFLSVYLWTERRRSKRLVRLEALRR